MPDRSRNNVLNMIVANNLCIGCGVCAAVCPKRNLEIRFNEYGEYNALETNAGCLEKCNLCLKVCPFYDNEDNEDTLGKKSFADIAGIKHTPETGYYLESYVGYSKVNGHRENGASGGLATCMLETLLRENLVDYVACVSPNKDPNRLFKFVICHTPEEVRACSRSCYYPVETSEVLRYILEHDERYAIIGLPCFCKAIRLAMQNNLKLQERIKFVLGLVCGQTKSKFFTEYICALGGGDPHGLKKVTFRIKDPTMPASDFGLRFTCMDGKSGVVFWKDGMNHIWCDRYFTPNACNFCDDVFAEAADVCFMDAWLNKYSWDWRGHNIVLIRDKRILELVKKEMATGTVRLNELDIKHVIGSQKSVLDVKRNDIKERRRLAGETGQKVPEKREYLYSNKMPGLRKKIVMLTWLISQKSPAYWVASDKRKELFLQEMESVIKRLNRIKFIYRGQNFFRRLISKVPGIRLFTGGG